MSDLMKNDAKRFALGLIFLGTFAASFIAGFVLGFKNGEYRNDSAAWQTIVTSDPPDVCGEMSQHLSQPGNWVGIKTQVNKDCQRRLILEFGSGAIDGIEPSEFGPTPTPAPFNIDPFDTDVAF